MRFIVLAMIRAGHRKGSQDQGLDDTTATLLALVLAAMVCDCPPRAVAAALPQTTNGGTPAEFGIHTHEEPGGLSAIQGGGLIASKGVLALLNGHVFGKPETLARDRIETRVPRYEAVGWTIVGSPGPVSMLRASTVPRSLLPLAGWPDWRLAVAMPVLRASRRRRHRSMLAEAAKRATAPPRSSCSGRPKRPKKTPGTPGVFPHFSPWGPACCGDAGPLAGMIVASSPGSGTPRWRRDCRVRLPSRQPTPQAINAAAIIAFHRSGQNASGPVVHCEET